MSPRFSRKLPENCRQCGKAEAGVCPYHVGEKRDRRLTNKIIRGSRKLLPLDGVLPGGHSLRPNAIVLLPTLTCNLSCVYCFQRRDADTEARRRPEKRLGAAEWQAVIDEIRPLGLPVIVMGGELFLYPEISTLLRAIKSADLPLTVITNGFELARFADELVDLGLDQLTVSLDGPAEIHNRVRNHPESFQSAALGLRRVFAARGVCSGPQVQVSCTLSTFTQSHLLDFVETMGALGVDRIVFNSLIFARAEQIAAQAKICKRDFGTDYSGSGLNNEAFSRVDPAVLRRQLAAIRSGPWSDRVFVAPPGVEQNLEAYYAPPTRPFQRQFCTAIYRELWILPEGDVAACGHLPELVMGNVCREGLLAVWNGPRFRLLRQRLSSGLFPACGRCEKLTYEQP